MVDVPPDPQLQPGPTKPTYVLGKGMKPEHAQQVIRECIRLAPNERVLYVGKCLSAFPNLDTLVVTTEWVVAAERKKAKVNRHARLADVESITADRLWGELVIVDRSGETKKFPGMGNADDPATVDAIFEEHLPQIQRLTRAERKADEKAAKEQPSEPVELTGRQQRAAEKQLDKQERRAERRQNREERRAADEDEAAVVAQDILANYGRLVADERFGGFRVKIYDLGYVQMSALWMKGDFERLVHVETSDSLQKKSAFGRTLGAVATVGLNLATPSNRGDVYLTIVTEQQTHTLHEELPTRSVIETWKTLEGAARGVLERQARAEQAVQAAPPQSQAAPEPTAADRLREVTAMRDDGLINDEECAALRGKILGSL